MKYFHFISNIISDRIDNNINHSIIITGCHRSGKTTMMKELIGDYPYTKWEYDYHNFEMNVQNWRQLSQYNIFDRSPIIDKYVHAYPYSSGKDSMNEEMLLKLQIQFFESHIKYFIKPLFVIYLHSVWDDGTKPQYSKKETRSIEVYRYLNMIDYLNKHKYQVIVCTEKYIKTYNI